MYYNPRKLSFHSFYFDFTTSLAIKLPSSVFSFKYWSLNIHYLEFLCPYIIVRIKLVHTLFLCFRQTTRHVTSLASILVYCIQTVPIATLDFCVALLLLVENVDLFSVIIFTLQTVDSLQDKLISSDSGCIHWL